MLTVESCQPSKKLENVRGDQTDEEIADFDVNTCFKTNSIWKLSFRFLIFLFSFCWSRATLKGPKRSFVEVVIVLLGVESSSKMFLGTKNVLGNKKCSREQKTFYGTKNVPKETNKGLIRAKCYLLWHTVVLNCSVCLVWHLRMAICGLLWSCYCKVWPHST